MMQNQTDLILSRDICGMELTGLMIMRQDCSRGLIISMNKNKNFKDGLSKICDFIMIDDETKNIPERKSKAQYNIVFKAELPSQQLMVFTLTRGPKKAVNHLEKKKSDFTQFACNHFFYYFNISFSNKNPDYFGSTYWTFDLYTRSKNNSKKLEKSLNNSSYYFHHVSFDFNYLGKSNW
jgi:hypothetical protein